MKAITFNGKIDINIRFLVKILIIVFCLSLAEYTFAQPTNYEKRVEDNHVIHILQLDPTQYNVSLVKAQNQVLGRETVATIADHSNADIAINAGYFEMGGNRDGMPSSTLIIDGKIYGLVQNEQAALIINKNDHLQIKKIAPKLAIKINKHEFHPQKVNTYISEKESALYTAVWGQNSPETLSKRKEIIIAKNNKILQISNHSNNDIPEQGAVLSLPPTANLSMIQVGAPVKIIWKGFPSRIDHLSIVRGIPLLVSDGKINNQLSKFSDYFKAPHARTAIGLLANGTIIVVVAEHRYQQVISDGQVSHTSQINTSDTSLFPEGLTLQELAELMQKLGCVVALNLDGGGSSSLYINHKIVNLPFGDEDEGIGALMLRPVSDAIIFKHRKHVK